VFSSSPPAARHAGAGQGRCPLPRARTPSCCPPLPVIMPSRARR
jgi:hypothetical protein